MEFSPLSHLLLCQTVLIQPIGDGVLPLITLLDSGSTRRLTYSLTLLLTL